MAETLTVETVDLVKGYGGTAVVDRVSLAVPAGSILGLLGPNGAGKSTIVRLLSTLVRPDSGTARVDGLDVVSQASEVRRHIGLTGQSTSVDGDLSGEQNLRMIGRLLGLPRREARRRASEALEEAGLAGAARTQAKAYSGGMQRRLDLAMSLLARPSVVFLDEPTTGLDPARRGETWSMIRRLSESGCAVLLTTQYLEEADHLADQIVVIDQGRVIAEGTPDSLKRRLGSQALEMRIREHDQVERAVAIISALLDSHPRIDPGRRAISVPIGDTGAMARVVRALDDAGIGVDELQSRLPSLDDVFLDITGTVRGTAVTARGVDA